MKSIVLLILVGAVLSNAKWIFVKDAVAEDAMSGGKIALISEAKQAQTEGRFDDMAKKMAEATKLSWILDKEQRKLLAVAFNNVVGAKRLAWRSISGLQPKQATTAEESELNSKYCEEVKQLANTKEQLERAIKDRADEVLDLIKYLLVKVDDMPNHTEAKVFYLKMRGDFYRYLVEVTPGNSRDDLKDKARAAYESAKEEAKQGQLPSTNPIKMRLALNFAAFYYDILNNGMKAYELAKEGFDAAIIADLDNMKEEDMALVQKLHAYLNVYASAVN